MHKLTRTCTILLILLLLAPSARAEGPTTLYVPMVKGTGESWDAGVPLEVVNWRYVMTRPAPPDYGPEWGYLEIVLGNPYPVPIVVGNPANACYAQYWVAGAWAGDPPTLMSSPYDTFSQCYLPPDDPCMIGPWACCAQVIIPPHEKAIVQWATFGFLELVELHPVGKIANY